MVFDYGDFKKSVHLQRNNISDLRGVMAAAVSLSRLTENDDWNRYLSYLQAAIEKFRDIENGANESILKIETVNHEKLLQLKMISLEARTFINALQFAMSIPKELKDGAEAAEKILQDFTNAKTSESID